VKRTVWIALTVAALLAWGRGPVRAQDNGPAMQVATGFGGYCREDSWCPVYVLLSNEGADIEGELRVGVDSDGADVYTRRVVLPAHSRKAYFLYCHFPVSGYPRGYLAVRLLAGRETLASEQAAVTWLDSKDRLYGIASGDPSALNFLSDVEPPGGEAEVAHLDLRALPPDPLGWEALDVLVFSDVDASVLDEEQRRRALETWVTHGGHLIVGGGAGAARTAEGLADLLPVAVGGARSVDDLWALGERLGASVVTGPYAVAEATLRDGAALIEQDDLILLARRAHGAGRVDFLAFDAGLNPFARWDSNVKLWKETVVSEPAHASPLVVRNGASAREAINAIPGLELPSTLQILAFLLVYTLLIGPINYVVLRKFGRRELAWLTIPALILGFTVCAYVTGFQIRGGEAIVHRLGVVYVPQEAETGRVSQAVGLFSPRRTNYDVWVSGAEARQIPSDYYGAPESPPLSVSRQAAGSTVSGLRVDVGGIHPFAADGYVDVSSVEADLRLEGDEEGKLWLQGIVRNGETPLQDAVLIVGDDDQRLGGLEPGEEIDVRLQLLGGAGVSHAIPMPPSYYSGVIQQILGPGDYWNDRALRRRFQFLQALFDIGGSYGSSPMGSGSGQMGWGSGVHLVGWTEEQCPLPVEVMDRPFSTIETALYVYALPATGLETGVSVVIPSSLIERQTIETSGPVDIWPEGFHMEPGSRVEFRFVVWSEMMVQRVDELTVELRGSSYGANGTVSSSPPKVLLWSRESGAWEQIDLGWGQISIADADAYVSPSGHVLLRLETGDTEAVDVERLAITIKGQR